MGHEHDEHSETQVSISFEDNPEQMTILEARNDT